MTKWAPGEGNTLVEGLREKQRGEMCGPLFIVSQGQQWWGWVGWTCLCLCWGLAVQYCEVAGLGSFPPRYQCVLRNEHLLAESGGLGIAYVDLRDLRPQSSNAHVPPPTSAPQLLLGGGDVT